MENNFIELQIMVSNTFQTNKIKYKKKCAQISIDCSSTRYVHSLLLC